MTMSQGTIKTLHRDTIMDSVHGSIGILDHETQVIDHPLFQRLRHVLQNDVLHLTFVGGTHTRLAHSIGATHIATRIYSQLVHSRRAQMEADGGTRVTKAQEYAIAYLEQCLRLAILLHDCGHGAFSHQVEKSDLIQTILKREGLFDQLWAGVDTSTIYQHVPSHLHHEHYSVRAGHKILTDIDLEKHGIQIADVLNIMETTDGEPSEYFIEQCQLAWPILASCKGKKPESGHTMALHIRHLLSCILSGEFDADKADYLLRDSMYTGVSYGKYDIDTLINNLSVAWLPDADWLGLTINQKGIGALQDMVHCRYQMYMYVYNHKTTNGMESLLHLAISEFLQNEANSAQMDAFLTNIDEFVYLTDDFFWERFRNRARIDPHSYAYAIVHRNKLKHLGTEENLPPFRMETVRKELAEKIGVSEDRVVKRTNRSRFSKIDEHYTDIKVVVKDPISGTRSLRTVAEVSDFFTKFRDNTTTAFHLLPKREGKG